MHCKTYIIILQYIISAWGNMIHQSIPPLQTADILPPHHLLEEAEFRASTDGATQLFPSSLQPLSTTHGELAPPWEIVFHLLCTRSEATAQFVHGTTQQWASVLTHVAWSLVLDRIASVTQWTGLQPCLPLRGRKALPIRVAFFSSSSSRYIFLSFCKWRRSRRSLQSFKSSLMTFRRV